MLVYNTHFGVSNDSLIAMEERLYYSVKAFKAMALGGSTLMLLLFTKFFVLFAAHRSINSERVYNRPTGTRYKCKAYDSNLFDFKVLSGVAFLSHFICVCFLLVLPFFSLLDSIQSFCAVVLLHNHISFLSHSISLILDTFKVLLYGRSSAQITGKHLYKAITSVFTVHFNAIIVSSIYCCS